MIKFVVFFGIVLWREVVMKKWLVMIVATLLITGCSFDRVQKWLDNMEWERDDQTIKIVDIFFK
jgi:uncharacterized lipoprotein YajG